jgi:AcrR family transcriptional regulator
MDVLVVPRVTDAHRQARRDEIADAAVRVLRRRGVSNTSIAQIVEESGLSAGAVYANFENKAELARYVAQSLLDWRVGEIDDAAAAGAVRSPAEVMRTLFSTLEAEAPPIPLILQFWAEATTDPDLHEVLRRTVTALRVAFERAIRPWAEAQGGDVDELVRRTAVTMIVMSQGFLANTALLGWISFEDYLATATAMLETRP